MTVRRSAILLAFWTLTFASCNATEDLDAIELQGSSESPDVGQPPPAGSCLGIVTCVLDDCLRGDEARSCGDQCEQGTGETAEAANALIDCGFETDCESAFASGRSEGMDCVLHQCVREAGTCVLH